MLAIYRMKCDRSFLGPTGHFNAVPFSALPVAHGQARDERRVARVPYLRGRPASEWMSAVSKRGRSREDAPLTEAA